MKKEIKSVNRHFKYRVGGLKIFLAPTHVDKAEVKGLAVGRRCIVPLLGTASKNGITKNDILDFSSVFGLDGGAEGGVGGLNGQDKSYSYTREGVF